MCEMWQSCKLPGKYQVELTQADLNHVPLSSPFVQYLINCSFEILVHTVTHLIY